MAEKKAKRRTVVDVIDVFNDEEAIKSAIEGDKPKVKARGLVKFNKKQITLMGGRPNGYVVDVVRIHSHKEFSDWIFHFQEKSWVTPQMLWDFIWAVYHIKGHPSGWE